MNSVDARKVKELFARLFVIATTYKMNLLSFTKNLERSVFVNKIEDGEYSDYFNNSIEDIFFDITGFKIDEDNSYGIYNDAYWSGYSYFELHQRLNKPFSYLFLKLPLSNMLDIYPIFHEMDFSSLAKYFDKKDEEKTILRLLCENKGVSIPSLSKDLDINLASLKKYNSSDEMLHKASFQNIYLLSKYFDVPIQLFVR